MKNLHACIVFFIVIAGFSTSLTAQPQYYNYSGSGNGSNNFPFNVTTGKDIQLLYLAGEFNQPSAAPSGNIVSIALYLNSNLGPATYSNLTIKLGQSTITSLTAGAFYTGPMTTVYTRASVTISCPAASWLTFTLDTPFSYDPTMSLIVDIGQCGGTGTLGGACAYTNLSGVRRVWSVGGCPFVPYNSSSIYVYNMGITLGASLPPTAVTGSATSVTATAATLNGMINANGASTDVTFDYGLTAAYGNTVPGVPSPVTGATNTPVSAAITGLLPGNTYHYRVNGVNAQGTTNGGDSTFVTPPVPPAVVTLGAGAVTSTSATLYGTVNAGGALTNVLFEYGPTAAYGLTVPGVPATVSGNLDTPVSVDVIGLTPDIWYHYRVVGVNVADTTYGSDTSFYTSTCPMPGLPGQIAGTDTACGNSTGNIYSVDSISYAVSYEWTVPPDAVITAGAGTNSITVTFGNTSGNITVHGVDTCGNGPVGSLPVLVTAAPVPTISGIDSMCVSSGYYDYVTEAGMTNYIWTLSAGGTITYGLGTNQVQVLWNSPGAQSVNVNYMGPTGCFAGSPTLFPVAVTPLPGPAGSITGTDSLCAGTTGIAYSTTAITDATAYIWTLPAGATIVSGEWTQSITVDFALDASPGDITVNGNNVCGNGQLSPVFPVAVFPIPPDPVITLSGDTLTSDAPAGNQWYLDGAAIPGATGQMYIVTQNGEYWCDVTLNGCLSDTSNHIDVILTGVDPLQSGNFSIRPVPNDGRFTVTMTWPGSENLTIQIFNNLGIVVREIKDIRVKGTHETTIDLRPAPNGIYTVVIRGAGAPVIRKIVVNN